MGELVLASRGLRAAAVAVLGAAVALRRRREQERNSTRV